MEWIEVGFASKPHGIRGELRVVSSALSAARLLKCSQFALRTDKRMIEFEPEKARIHQDKLILKAPQIKDRNEAELWRNAQVLIPEDQIPEADPDALELVDIQGFTVQTVDGQPVGTVKDLIELPTQDCLVIDDNGREKLIPWVDAFVKSVDLEKGGIVIAPIDGLLDHDEN